MSLRLITHEGNAGEELPLVLSVEEAAAILRISRSAAYEQVRRFRETEGREGLPVVAIGRTLRVPRQGLLALLEVRPSESHGAT